MRRQPAGRWLEFAKLSPTGFLGPGIFAELTVADSVSVASTVQEIVMNSIIYIVGLVVVVGAVLSLIGFA